MDISVAVWLFIIISLVTANLPWLSERFLFLISLPGGRKNVWLRLLELLLMYGLMGLLAIGLERKLFGTVHSQQWEFFAASLPLFLVFALPGFIYHTELKRYFKRRSK